MGKIEFVYFDCGGVFLDFSASLTNFCRLFDLDEEDFGEKLKDFAGEFYLGKLNFEEFCIQNGLVNKAHSSFIDIWMSYQKPIPETHKVALQAKGKYRVGVITNAWPKMIDTGLGKFVPDLNYAVFIDSSVVKMKKPDKNIFELAEKLSNTEKSKILIVEDDERNIQTAKNLGWQTFQFDTKNPKSSSQKLKTLLKL